MKKMMLSLFFAAGFQTIALAEIPAPTTGQEPAVPTPEDAGATPDTVVVEQPAGRPTADTTSSNNPSWEWYADMHQQLYNMQQHAGYIKKGAYSYELGYYADWLYRILDQLYSSTYDSYGKPKQYSWGYATRGDFNHVYYYYIRPLYKKVIYYSGEYYGKVDSYTYAGYSKYLTPFYHGYHSLSRCMYGQNGKDMSAEDDTEFAALEAQAGLH